ncbi:MAG: hypothetical protein KC731_19780, partial [Myxococcales bacterium]|nr:hypothetical protein [Myxococcales bacterium]
DQAVPRHRFPIEGGWLPKPGGPPVPAGKRPLFELVDVTSDGVPEVRFNNAGVALWDRDVFLMRLPGRGELVHLAALDDLPNLRVDAAARRLVSEETLPSGPFRQPLEPWREQSRNEYVWERGELVMLRQVERWRGSNHRYEPIDEGAIWRREIERQGDRYEVVFNGLESSGGGAPAPATTPGPSVAPLARPGPTFPDVLAPKMLDPAVPPAGLRVPLPIAPGIPRCDLYFDGEQLTEGDVVYAREVYRIVVAGGDCAPHLVWDSHDFTGLEGLHRGGVTLVDVTFDGVPEIRIDGWRFMHPHPLYLMVDPSGTTLMHVRALDELHGLEVDARHERLTRSGSAGGPMRFRSAYEWREGRLIEVVHMEMHSGTPPEDDYPVPPAMGLTASTWLLQLEQRGDGYEVVWDAWAPVGTAL